VNLNYLVIVNPISGCGKGIVVARHALQKYETPETHWDLIISEYKGHAMEIVATCDIGKYVAIVIFGGDGTMHEVVNGMLFRNDNVKVPLGLVPVGTGNSLMRDYGCISAKQSLARIFSESKRPLDVLKIQFDHKCRYGINFVGCGFPALVNEYAEKMRLFRSQRYNLASLLAIMSYKPFELSLTFGEKNASIPADFIIGSNTVHIGSGLQVSPNARTDDGLIDLLALRPTTHITLLRLFLKLLRGTHLEDPLVDYHMVKNFSVMALNRQASLNIDGEIYNFSHMKVEVLSREIDLLV